MKAYIFDVDGVITNPETKIPNPRIIKFLDHILSTSDILCINTGRSISWLQNNLFNKLGLTQKNKTIFFSCEEGGIWGYIENGELKSTMDQNQTISNGLQEKVKELAAKYSTLFYDDSKKTMISIEMKNGLNTRDFEKEKNELLPQLEKLIDEFDDQYVTSTSAIALDIQRRFEGKDQGANRILSMWAEKNLSPDQVITVGDSPTDILMAEELRLAGFTVEFVYVGDKPLEGNTDIKIISTQEKYENGTLEYLSEIS